MIPTPCMGVYYTSLEHKYFKVFSLDVSGRGRQMMLKSWRQCQPDFKKSLFGKEYKRVVLVNKRTVTRHYQTYTQLPQILILARMWPIKEGI